MLVVSVVLAGILGQSAFLVSLAVAQPAETGGDESADNEAVIPPGQEELLADMLGRGTALPAQCQFANAQADGAILRSIYTCPAGEVVFELRHPTKAPNGAVQTAKFAIVVQKGSPPEELTATLVSRIRSREGDFEWKWLGESRRRSSLWIVLLPAAVLIVIAALRWALGRRSAGRAASVFIVLAIGWSAVSATERTDTPPGIVDVMREQILTQLALKPGMAVGEIGVGGGWFVVRVAEAVGPHGVVYGTDVDPAAIAALQRKLSSIKPASARVELRLCRDGRDTGLDDLPDDRLDLVLMVDSLCFDAQVPRDTDVAYLRRFLRILRPGGRLVHHMDCRCDVARDAVVAKFTDAGFATRVESFDVSPNPSMVDSEWPCQTEAERKRHAFVAVFRKPGATTDAGVGAARP